MTRAEQILSEYLDEITKRAAEEAAQACKAASNPDEVKSASAALLRAMGASSSLAVAIEEHAAKQDYINKLVNRCDELEKQAKANFNPLAESSQEIMKRLEAQREELTADNAHLRDSLADLEAENDRLRAQLEEARTAARVADQVAVDEVSRRKEAEAKLEKMRQQYQEAQDELRNVRLDNMAHEVEADELRRKFKALKLEPDDFEAEAAALDKAAKAEATEAGREWTPGTVDKKHIGNIYAEAYRDGWNGCRAYHNIKQL